MTQLKALFVSLLVLDEGNVDLRGGVGQVYNVLKEFFCREA